ncbi:CSL zinc finger protein [Apodospora peruviana]|uniref:Diphthamide biosynthesis protein 4 n=1 Tax=Apodospora peruviana TaxID=516989 RepID=A0AAE0IPV2_9PEZI|nr:CSL zinc finger protein [Apodospora peruviana]
MSQSTYYEILGISASAIDHITTHDHKNSESKQKASKEQFIKRAYRRALLSHHPDKQQTKNGAHPQPPLSPASSSSSSAVRRFTVDQISQAFAILSNPSQRAEYDRQLLLVQQQNNSNPNSLSGGKLFQTGIETVDLDDLSFDDSAKEVCWYRSCRCGNPRGYLIPEADLEEAADLGELMVGCADCSLWLRVHFAVVDDDINSSNR